MKTYLLVALSILSLHTVRAQSVKEVWDLNKCIEYAHQNSIAVQQSEIVIQNKHIDLNSNKLNRLPTVGGSVASNMNFGRHQTESGIYTNTKQISGSLGLSASVPLFQAFKISRQIDNSKLNLEAAMQDLERAKNDIALNITALYLQVLFNKELYKVAERQLQLSTIHLNRSKSLVESGRSPESTVYESQSLKSNDELNLTECENQLAMSLLDLSQAINRPSAEGFDIVQPDLSDPTITSYASNDIYNYAVKNLPQIKAEELRVAGSRKSLAIARSSYYPSISMSAGYGSSLFKSYADGAFNPNFRTQLKNNASESIGLSMSIPIFNGYATRNQVRMAKLNVQSQELRYLENIQKLRKEIEQAFYSAKAAYLKYQSAVKAYESAEIAFEYVNSKAELGRSTVFDYNDARVRMERAESEQLQAKYDFIFRTKILNFYAGEPLMF